MGSKGHRRARTLHPVLTTCERCGLTQAMERHHRDGDPDNNDRSNLLFSCRGCHREMHPVTAEALAVLDRGRARSQQIRGSRTHCSAGHEYTPETTYYRDGYRHCRLCRRVYQERYRAKNP